MPFTLAHPAAVVPLKRFCPKYLSYSALLVGSVVPDVGYCFNKYGLEDLSHRFEGSFLFCLPVGMLMLAAIFLLRKPVVAWVPEPHRTAFRPLCKLPFPSPLIAIISILVGSWTHQLWDLVTHSHSQLVMGVPLLHEPLFVVDLRPVLPGRHTFIVSHLLWYASSFGGVAILCFLYERWLVSSLNARTPATDAAAVRHAILVGLLVLPIELIHHLFANVAGFAVLGICSIVLVFFVALKLGNVAPRQMPE